MAEERYYPNCAVYLDALAKHLEEAYSSFYDVQLIAVDDAKGKGAIFQARGKYDTQWKRRASKFTGLDTAVTAKMMVQDDGLTIQVGGAKWFDKAAVVAAGATVWALIYGGGLLLIPVGIGALKQRSLIKKVVSDVDTFFKSVKPPSIMGVLSKCPKCGAQLREGAKFCGNCGNALES